MIFLNSAQCVSEKLPWLPIICELVLEYAGHSITLPPLLSSYFSNNRTSFSNRHRTSSEQYVIVCRSWKGGWLSQYQNLASSQRIWQQGRLSSCLGLVLPFYTTLQIPLRSKVKSKKQAKTLNICWLRVRCQRIRSSLWCIYPAVWYRYLPVLNICIT